MSDTPVGACLCLSARSEEQLLQYYAKLTSLLELACACLCNFTSSCYNTAAI